MMKLPFVLAFTALTFVSWGTYGILLHKGTHDMDGSALKPFVFVGVAYFFIAVLFPGFILKQKGEKGHWSFSGTILSFLAGVVGALGALGIILAMKFGGKPIYVMPFVFGLAPVVNTMVTATINRTFSQIKFLFVVGLALVILGAVGVLISKGSPTPPAHAEPTHTASATIDHVKLVAFQETATTDHSATESTHAAATTASAATPPSNSLVGTIFSMIMAAVCWGAYGPVLHIGQMRMGGSRLRPFCCVGLAYFFVAVAIPLIMLQSGMDSGKWNLAGAIWSTGAGALGAMGALGIIYAFNYGGKPIFVMPLVFGFAPIINTVVSMSVAGTLDQISPLFVGSLATTIAGAVMVLVFQPSSKGHGKPPAPVTPEIEPKPKDEKPTVYSPLPVSKGYSEDDEDEAHAPATNVDEPPIASPLSAQQTGKPDEPQA